jgi:uncharacterized protein (TIRG00374 family)
LRIFVSLGLLALVIWLADWRAIRAALLDVELAWVWVALALAMLDRLLLNLRWQMLLGALDQTIGFLKLLRIQLAANFLGSFLPSSIGVDAVRIAALCRAGLPTPQVVASTLVDRASIVLATLVFGSVMILALAGRELPEELRNWVLLATGIALGGCLVAMHPAVRKWLHGRLLRWLPQQYRDLAAEIAGSILAYRYEHARLAKVGLLTILVFLVRILFAKSLVLACGANASVVDLLLIIPVLWILVMLPVTIGGIGLQDAAYVGLMAIFGVPAAVAVAMSVLEHVITRAVALPGALFLGEVTAPMRAEGLDVANRT